MNPGVRLAATRYIWTAFFFGLAVVNSSIFMGQPLGIINLFTSIMVIAAAIVSTGFVWNWGSLPLTADAGGEQAQYEKAKRRDRVAALMDMLSDDELEALRARLADDEGEGRSLGALLSDDGEIVARR